MEQFQNIQQKAGGIIIRKRDGVIDVFLIHRHRYNDWSFPKGHVDAGESLEEAALREVREEAGVECQIIAPLPDMHYTDPTGTSHSVAWFLMVVVRETDSGLDETEVDGGEWVALDIAASAACSRLC